MNWLMDNMEGIAFIFFACAVFGAFAALFYQEKKRVEAIMAMAPRMGFTYKKVDESCRGSHLFLELFNEGEAQRFANVLEGVRNGVKVTMGEYDVRFGSGKGSVHKPKTICVIEDTALALPHFSLYTQHKLAAKIGAALGMQDINFSDDKKFSDAFILQGDNETEIRNFFDEKIRKAFMKFTGNEIQMEAYKNTLVVHRGATIDAQQWSPLLKDAFTIYEFLKTAGNSNQQ
ncbi:MAG: hypothetical protein ACD_39C01707G0002 [uncultured bacterium]|nr:MAG: hypothetical protein ACD_39C01707G0002 [uncultured bacterium]